VTELLALGTSHKTAPLALRERIALLDGGAEQLVKELTAHDSIAEAVALSTCNRTELYLVVSDPVEAESFVLGLLARRAALRPTELMEGMYSLRNCDAARHLYRVTSGLESMIVGEAEVQGQVKRAYELALAVRTTGPMTNKLFRAALATGKRVRTETAIASGRASVATAAVDAARSAIGRLQKRHVVIVGAGETAELTAQALHDQGVTTMFVANRRRERAIALAQRFGGASGSFDALPAELERADILISSTSSPHTLLGAEEIAAVMELRGGRPLLLVDLAVPRDIDHDCAAIPGVTVLDMDGLQRRVERHMSVRRAEARRAEGIVEEEIHAFAGWLGSLEVLPTLAALRAHGDAVVDRLLAENENRWEDLSDRDRARVESLARAVVNRLLHEPTARVKGLEAEQRHARLQLLRELFGLEDQPPRAAGEPDAAPAEVRTLRPR
jgi:glutamyl-tRNA reductase